VFLSCRPHEQQLEVERFRQPARRSFFDLGTGIRLGEQVLKRCVSHVTPRSSLLGPCDGRHAMRHDKLHQAMVGGMKVDLVDALAPAVEGMELGREAVRVMAELDDLGAASHLPEPSAHGSRPTRAVAIEGFAKRRIRLEEIAVFKWRRLVLDLVRA
jgi:hypothetical protein